MEKVVVDTDLVAFAVTGLAHIIVGIGLIIRRRWSILAAVPLMLWNLWVWRRAILPPWDFLGCAMLGFSCATLFLCVWFGVRRPSRTS